MKKNNERKTSRHVVRDILFATVCILIIMVVVCFVGQCINRKTPENGINESMYVDINGSQQWINIYGEDTNNPVLLYLHGGPGSATSTVDYVFTRKISDVYTVVTWDQRNSGKSYNRDQRDTTITYDLMLSDGLEMTKYILNYMGKDKLTILGHSWGSLFGAKLVQEYPEYYEAYIGASQLLDPDKNEESFLSQAQEWLKDDPDGKAYIDKLTNSTSVAEYHKVKNGIIKHFGYDTPESERDYTMLLTLAFNPNYSVNDWIKYLFIENSAYVDFYEAGELEKFSVIDDTDYQMPYFAIIGENDYQADHTLAEDYYQNVNAPLKRLYIYEGGTHLTPIYDTDGFSATLHDISDKMCSFKNE